MQYLHRFLSDYDMAMLRALAQVRGVALNTNRQPEAVDQLAAALLDPLAVRVALARLSPEAREALDTLLALGGRMRAPQFGRRFGEVRAVGPGRLEREAPWQQPANAAEELWYAGLIYRAFYDDGGGPGEFVFIPDDLAALLPSPQTEPPAFAVEVVPAPSQYPGDELALVHDLFAYLVFLHNRDVRPYADGRLGRRDLSALRARLRQPEERRLALVRAQAERLGFVARQDDLLRLEAAAVKRWLTASPAQQIAELQEAWRDDPGWNDLCQVPGLVCDREAAWRPQNDPVATRRALLALLGRCPLDAWWSAASFVATVKEVHPDFQRPDGDYTSWYIRDAASGEYLSGFESWELVEGALIADLLAGPLRWLGVVAAVAGEAGIICRLTAAGARLLGLVADEPEEIASPPIVVHPDLSVEAPAPASLYTRFQLERFADLASVDPCRYQLTAGGLQRALARGVRVEQVLAFLRQASEGKVPANVAGQLHTWAERFGQVKLEEAAVLTVKNERVLRELAVLPETRSLIGRALSATSALVRRKDLPGLRKALRDLGYLPAEDEGNLPERG
jgi:hypothetical protein